MATKGQKFNTYDLNQIDEIIKYANKDGVTNAAKKYFVPLGTIWTWQSKYRIKNSISKKQRYSKVEKELMSENKLKEKYILKLEKEVKDNYEKYYSLKKTLAFVNLYSLIKKKLNL